MPRKVEELHRREDRRLLDDEDPAQVARGIRECLRYLYDEALKVGLRLTAHFIGVAEESIPRNNRNGGSDKP
jgi:hypothetical protein